MTQRLTEIRNLSQSCASTKLSVLGLDRRTYVQRHLRELDHRNAYGRRHFVQTASMGFHGRMFSGRVMRGRGYIQPHFCSQSNWPHLPELDPLGKRKTHNLVVGPGMYS